PVECLGTLWIVAQSQAKRCFGLLEISPLKIDRAVVEIVAMKFQSIAEARKRQGFRHSFRSGLGDLPQILLDLLWIHRPLINLVDLPATVNQERSGKTEVAMPVKKITIKNVVNPGELIR